MTIGVSFESFWRESGFKKISKAQCANEFSKICHDESKGNFDLEAFTDHLIKCARERLSFIRTNAGHVTGEVHPLTWLRNREYKNDPKATLTKKQSPASRDIAKLNRQLTTINSDIRILSKRGLGETIMAEERRTRRLKEIQIKKNRVEKQIATLRDKQR
ncbi:hypothetical protein [Vibrio splendidus]|uniref:hypothetical protein n=1 Tax=Vibrio splendidus TaxID=29497 RepID=UPI000769EED9|nr:hypothetical protein [Vibrio splendidus]PHX05474.1 hypothetical protein VSPL_28680 [Vibrio splendidus]